MQPGPVPEDIDSILSRFHTWAEKQPAPNGNGSAQRNGSPSDEVREVPYEEAIRGHRNRRAAQTAPPKPVAKKRVAPPQASQPLAPLSPALDAIAPSAEKKPQFVPSLELLAALRSATAAPTPRQAPPQPQVQPILFREEGEPATRPAANASPASSAPESASTRPTSAKNPAPGLAAGLRQQFAGATAAATASATIAPAPKAKPKTARQLKSAAAAQRPVRTSSGTGMTPRKLKSASVPESSLRPGPKIPNTRRLAQKAQAPRKAASGSVAQRRKPRPAPFRQVLTNTIQQPRLPENPRSKSVPDRTRRITTRFTPAEERRIEKHAAQLGLTVSAYLRHCVLATVAPTAELPTPPPAMLAPSGKAPQRTAQSPYPPNPYARQGSSLLGGWLALLRNRFLGPPIAFSDDA